MSIIDNLKHFIKSYETKNSEISCIFKSKLKKYKAVFEFGIEDLICKCLQSLNLNDQKNWELKISVIHSYNNGIGFSPKTVGEYRYENIYKVEFLSKKNDKNEKLLIPFLSFRTNAKSKFDYVNTAFPHHVTVNLLDLYLNEKKLEKLYIPLYTAPSKAISPYIAYVSKSLWEFIEINIKELILNKLLPEEIEKLCSLYESNAPVEEIQLCKKVIAGYQNELKTNKNEVIK